MRLPSYANVMATAAVFIALGGTGYAVSQLPKDSVGAEQIEKNAVRAPEVKKDAVRASEIKANAVSGPEVRDGSLGPADFDGSLPQGEPGPPGPTYAEFGDRADPPADPDSLPLHTSLAATVTTPSAGRLLAEFSISGGGDFGGVQVNCSSGNPTYGLYLDGAPVPDTAIVGLDEQMFPFVTRGVTGTIIPAGPHLIEVGVDCDGPGAPAGFALSGNHSLGAILLGSG